MPTLATRRPMSLPKLACLALALTLFGLVTSEVAAQSGRGRGGSRGSGTREGARTFNRGGGAVAGAGRGGVGRGAVGVNPGSPARGVNGTVNGGVYVNPYGQPYVVPRVYRGSVTGGTSDRR